MKYYTFRTEFGDLIIAYEMVNHVPYVKSVINERDNKPVFTSQERQIEIIDAIYDEEEKCTVKNVESTAQTATLKSSTKASDQESSGESRIIITNMSPSPRVVKPS